MRQLLLVAAGGALGASARYLASGAAQRLIEAPLPLGTLVVNVAGCALIGFLQPLLTGPWLLRPELRLALLVGVLGGFTTFSSYAWETLALARDGEWLPALGNVLLQNLLGLGAAFLAYRLAESLAA